MSVEKAAEFLAGLRIDHRTADGLPDELRPRDEPSAYQIQERVVRRLLDHHGGTIVGYKIACTNATAQTLLGSPGPVYGRLLSAVCLESPAHLAADRFHLRVVEPEFAFVIAADVPRAGAPYTRESILPYAGAIMPALEVVSHRFAGWDRFDGPVLVSDNACNGAWIAGERVSDWRGLDLAGHAVRLDVNGETVSTGDGARVLGHPLEALAWLANALAERGLGLRRGELVTTGLVTDVYAAAPGDRVRADFGVLGAVELRFD